MPTTQVQTALPDSDARRVAEMARTVDPPLTSYAIYQKLILLGMEEYDPHARPPSRRPPLRRRSALADRVDALIEQVEDLVARQVDYDPDQIGLELQRLMQGVQSASYVLPLSYGRRTETLQSLVSDFIKWLVAMDRADEVRDVVNAIAQSAEAALAGQEA